ncbi:MAG TPA: hypothetical protein VGB67_17755, partial [Fibrella sp.]
KAPTAAVASADYKFDPTRFDQYAGAYEMAEMPGFIMTFKREGNRYFVQPTGQPQSELFALSDSTFFSKLVDAQVVFHHVGKGTVNRITLKQNGNHPGNRVTAQAASVTPKHQFVGKYYSPELETFYTISLKDDVLKLVHIHHGEVTLTVTAKDRLTAPWWFVQNINIVRDAADQVTGLRMSNGRVVNLWFKRLADDFGATMSPTASK